MSSYWTGVLDTRISRMPHGIRYSRPGEVTGPCYGAHKAYPKGDILTELEALALCLITRVVTPVCNARALVCSYFGAKQAL